MMVKYPEYDEKLNFVNEEKQIEQIKEVITGIRNVRTKMNVHPTKKVELIFVCSKYSKELEESKSFIEKLGFGSNVIIQNNKNGIKENAVSIIKDGIELYMPHEGLVDLEEEAKRKEEERKKIEFEIERAEKMLTNPGFVNKAPQAKIDEEKAKLEKYKQMLEKLKY